MQMQMTHQIRHVSLHETGYIFYIFCYLVFIQATLVFIRQTVSTSQISQLLTPNGLERN